MGGFIRRIVRVFSPPSYTPPAAQTVSATPAAATTIAGTKTSSKVRGAGYGTTTVMTDSTGKAESTFIVNSSDFETSGATNIDFNVFLQENSLVTESLTLSYFIEGSQDPETDISEFHYYPDSDTINHALYEQTSISVIAKNNAGVGISNVLVRFDLDESRDSFGELSSGYEYTCCGENDEGASGEETYACEDGSGCDPEGEPCADGSGPSRVT